MPPNLANAAQLLGRVLMAVIFILGGWSKLHGQEGTTAYLVSNGFPLPAIAYWVAVVTELGGGLLILCGLLTRPAALLLAGFCVVTAVVVHFQPDNAGQMTHYYKNLSMAGGFLQLFAVGAGGWSLDALLRSKSA